MNYYIVEEYEGMIIGEKPCEELEDICRYVFADFSLCNMVDAYLSVHEEHAKTFMEDLGRYSIAVADFYNTDHKDDPAYITCFDGVDYRKIFVESNGGPYLFNYYGSCILSCKNISRILRNILTDEHYKAKVVAKNEITF